MMSDRIVIVGASRSGKSWLACELGGDSHGAPTRLYTGAVPVRCGDPLSTVKEPIQGVEYLPEGLAMEDESTRWIVDNWFTLPGPWVCEGWIMARALRKWLVWRDEECDPQLPLYPCDRIIVFENQRHDCDLKRGQIAQHRGVLKVWREIAEYFEPITEYR